MWLPFYATKVGKHPQRSVFTCHLPPMWSEEWENSSSLAQRSWASLRHDSYKKFNLKSIIKYNCNSASRTKIYKINFLFNKSRNRNFRICISDVVERKNKPAVSQEVCGKDYCEILYQDVQELFLVAKSVNNCDD